jgi:ABC-type cobalamin/Fe3+-siderophores transport system ATPase subunit
MIQISHLSVFRGKREIIKDFSASIPAASITAITGANGSGKSTLLAALAGDLEYQGGEIKYASRELREISLKEQSAIRSVVLQNQSYWLSFTAREVISMGQDQESLARLDSILDVLDMKGFADQAVTTLSGGQSQRVEIARALIRDTPVYLLDEPLSAQDTESKLRIIAYLESLRDQGKTILVIAHIDRTSLMWCNQVVDLLEK